MNLNKNTRLYVAFNSSNTDVYMCIYEWLFYDVNVW